MTNQDHKRSRNHVPTTPWERILGLAMLFATIVAITWLILR